MGVPGVRGNRVRGRGDDVRRSAGGLAGRRGVPDVGPAPLRLSGTGVGSRTTGGTRMWLRVLGSAAGGGFPQWNCSCPACRAVRDGSRPCRSRTQSSIAVSADYRRWFLLNASPDIRAQIESFPPLHPRGVRNSPLQAVLLTDAELDHTLGLLLLREAGDLEVHATAAVHETLRRGTSLLQTLRAYTHVEWQPVATGIEVSLADGLSYRAFHVPTDKRARFGTGEGEEGVVVGYRITDGHTGRVLVYVPGAQELMASVRAHLEGCTCLHFDGT